VAGIGITPALSVVRTADRIDHEAPIHVDLSVRHRTHAAEIDVLQEMAVNRHVIP
jgi:ferredoxin-NADP reductase